MGGRWEGGREWRWYRGSTYFVLHQGFHQGGGTSFFIRVVVLRFSSGFWSMLLPNSGGVWSMLLPSSGGFGFVLPTSVSMQVGAMPHRGWAPRG